jgi:hypothetical protein
LNYHCDMVEIPLPYSKDILMISQGYSNPPIYMVFKYDLYGV